LFKTFITYFYADNFLAVGRKGIQILTEVRKLRVTKDNRAFFRNTLSASWICDSLSLSNELIWGSLANFVGNLLSYYWEKVGLKKFSVRIWRRSRKFLLRNTDAVLLVKEAHRFVTDAAKI